MRHVTRKYAVTVTSSSTSTSVEVLRRGSLLVEAGKWIAGLLAWGLTISVFLWGLRWHSSVDYAPDDWFGEITRPAMPFVFGVLAASTAIGGIIAIWLVIDATDRRLRGPFWEKVTHRIDPTDAARTVLDVPETTVDFNRRSTPVRKVPRKHARRFTAIEVEVERSRKRARREKEAARKVEQQEMRREHEAEERREALWREEALQAAAEGRSWKANRR